MKMCLQKDRSWIASYISPRSAETMGQATVRRHFSRPKLCRRPNLIARMMIEGDALTPLRCLVATSWLWEFTCMCLCERPCWRLSNVTASKLTRRVRGTLETTIYQAMQLYAVQADVVSFTNCGEQANRFMILLFIDALSPRRRIWRS